MLPGGLLFLCRGLKSPFLCLSLPRLPTAGSSESEAGSVQDAARRSGLVGRHPSQGRGLRLPVETGGQSVPSVVVHHTVVLGRYSANSRVAMQSQGSVQYCSV